MRISVWSSDVCSSDLDQSVESTIQKIARGKPTQGWPTLAEHLGEEVVQRCKDFVFGVEEAEGHTRPLAMPEDDGYDPYSDVQTLSGTQSAEVSLDLSSGWDDPEDDAGEDDARLVAFERMVQHEVLRMEVREEASLRYRANKEPEDSETLVRLAPEVLEAEPAKQRRIQSVLPWGNTLWRTR